jgi:hypothetical protein
MVALRKIFILCACTALVVATAAGATVKRSWLAAELAAAEAGADEGGLPRMSDVVQDIWVDGAAAWVATVDGLGVTRDHGSSWRTYRQGDGLPSSDVVAVATYKGDIWASCIDVIDLGFGAFTYYGKGLAHYDGAAGRWYVYGKRNGLPADGRGELVWDVVVVGRRHRQIRRQRQDVGADNSQGPAGPGRPSFLLAGEARRPYMGRRRNNIPQPGI